MEDTLVLPDDFGIPEDDRLDITIRNMEEVLNASERLMEFCDKHGINKKDLLRGSRKKQLKAKGA